MIPFSSKPDKVSIKNLSSSILILEYRNDPDDLLVIKRDELENIKLFHKSAPFILFKAHRKIFTFKA